MEKKLDNLHLILNVTRWPQLSSYQLNTNLSAILWGITETEPTTYDFSLGRSTLQQTFQQTACHKPNRILWWCWIANFIRFICTCSANLLRAVIETTRGEILTPYPSTRDMNAAGSSELTRSSRSDFHDVNVLRLAVQCSSHADHSRAWTDLKVTAVIFKIISVKTQTDRRPNKLRHFADRVTKVVTYVNESPSGSMAVTESMGKPTIAASLTARK